MRHPWQAAGRQRDRGYQESNPHEIPDLKRFLSAFVRDDADNFTKQRSQDSQILIHSSLYLDPH